MSEIIDVTMPLQPGMLLYPGNPPFEWEQYRLLSRGDSSNNSRFSMGSHVGTHVDAPSHYVDGGGTVEGLAAEVLIGPCRVVKMPSMVIDAASLRRVDLGGSGRVLFGTRSSQDLSCHQFRTEFAHVTADGADYLLENGVRLVGVDYLSVDRYRSPEHPAHNRLLGAGVIVVEGLDLSRVEDGDFELICCPLLIIGSEAAPARVFLRVLPESSRD